VASADGSGSSGGGGGSVETIDIIAMEEAAAADLLYEQRQGIKQFLAIRAAQFDISEVRPRRPRAEHRAPLASLSWG
jgi:hypothetical protein